MQDYEQLFHNHCNIMSGTYKWVGGWAAIGGLYLLLALFKFKVAMSPRSTMHESRHA